MEEKVYPWWVGYLLINPLRKLVQNPKKILESYVKEDMKVLDFGCAMGYFSLPLAKLVGEEGKVICVDVQQKMLNSLEKRAEKEKVRERIELRKCTQASMKISDLQEKIDFTLAFAVVHEISNQEIFFSEVYKVLKKGSNFLIAEPKQHVSEEKFTNMIKIIKKTEYGIIDYPKISGVRSVLLKKY